MKLLTPELINSLTPIIITTIGGVIGLTALFIADSDQISSAMGLAGTAIAGGAGLAQSGKNEMIISEKEEKQVKPAQEC